MIYLKNLIAIAVFVFILSPNCFSDTKTNRQKVIDFEDEIVEGVNKKPLDSFNQISENERRKKKPHLYKKRAGFKSEIKETLSTMRFQQ